MTQSCSNISLTKFKKPIRNCYFKLARKNPRWSVRKLTGEWRTYQSSKSSIGRSTVNRRLLDFQLESYNETEKQLLSKEDKKKRLKCDESNFQLVNRKTTARVRRFKNKKYESRFIKQRVQAGGGSVGICGAISSNGTGVCQ
ncbi:transposable element Tcb1 transposase, partial [Brachionus plicatilis]